MDTRIKEYKSKFPILYVYMALTTSNADLSSKKQLDAFAA